MADETPLLFALDSSREFGTRVAQAMSTELSRHEEREFEDGEHKARPLVSVRNRSVFVIQSLYGDSHASVNDKLCRLLFFIGALKDAAAGRVTAVVPYLCYARKDRKTKSRDPVTTRYVAALLESVGVDCVVTMDVHNLAAFENAFRCSTQHLEAKRLFVRHFASLASASGATVVSPDVGGVKRAEQLRQALSEQMEPPPTSAFMEKQRSGGVVSGETLVGDVRGRTAFIIDDLVSSGTTVARAARACRQAGAERVFAGATHGLFVGGAEQVVGDEQLDGFAITDTVPPFRLSERIVREKVTILDGAGLVGAALQRMHTGESIVDLLDPAPAE